MPVMDITWTRIDGYFFLAFVVVFLVWLILSAYLILDRVIYDIRHRSVRAAWAKLGDPEVQAKVPEARAEHVEQILTGLPRRTIDRVAADSSTPPWMAEAFSAFAFKRWGMDRLVQDASGHRGELGKWRRIAALRILSHGRHPDMLTPLQRAMNDPDRDVVGVAVTLLGRMDDRRAAELLIAALRRQVYPPSRIATLLDRFPLDIADLLRPLLKDRLPVARFWAATLLSRYAGSPDLDADLAALVDDPDPNVRKAAIETLGKVGGPHAAPAAMKLLDDAVWYVRAHAARALGDLQRTDLAEKITPLLADSEWWVRFAAKESLQVMGPGVAPQLIPYLDHPDGFARNGAAEVLQNLGMLDELIEKAVTSNGADSSKMELVRKVLSAGGAGMTQALVGRMPSDNRPAVGRLLESLGFEAVRRP